MLRRTPVQDPKHRLTTRLLAEIEQAHDAFRAAAEAEGRAYNLTLRIERGKPTHLRANADVAIAPKGGALQ